MMEISDFFFLKKVNDGKNVYSVRVMLARVLQTFLHDICKYTDVPALFWHKWRQLLLVLDTVNLQKLKQNQGT